MGLSPDAQIFHASNFDSKMETRIRDLWPIQSLENAYQSTYENLRESHNKIPNLSTQEALSESFKLGGNAIKILALDPLLPKEMIDTKLRENLHTSMEHYEKMGRPLWLEALESFNS